MIYLMQILRMLGSVEDLDFFEALVTDIAPEVSLGYSKTEAISVLLESHFGIEIIDERQLSELTRVITTRPDSLRAALNLERLRFTESQTL